MATVTATAENAARNRALSISRSPQWRSALWAKRLGLMAAGVVFTRGTNEGMSCRTGGKLYRNNRVSGLMTAGVGHTSAPRPPRFGLPARAGLRACLRV